MILMFQLLHLNADILKISIKLRTEINPQAVRMQSVVQTQLNKTRIGYKWDMVQQKLTTTAKKFAFGNLLSENLQASNLKIV